MKKTMNKYQRNYMLAKAHLETLRDIEKKMEHEYLKSRNIVNADGKTPEAIYCIDDENIFNTINEESTKLPEFEANWAEQLEAEKILESAENLLTSLIYKELTKGARQ
mgnify:CR=1 FL=1